MIASLSFHLTSVYSMMKGGALIQVSANGIRLQHALVLFMRSRCSNLYFNFILIAGLMIPGFCVGALSAIK